MTSRTYQATLQLQEGMSSIPVPFDPKAVFGKARAPVCVTLNGYSFRSTIAAMGGPPFVPLRRSHREAAGLEGTETLMVTLALDTDPREITPPLDLAERLRASPPAWERWQELSYTHQRECVEAVEAAKKPETRERRIAGALQQLLARPARKR